MGVSEMALGDCLLGGGWHYHMLPDSGFLGMLCSLEAEVCYPAATAEVEEEEPQPPTVNLENLTAEERDYLENHPLYIKIHQRGYPIPIGDLDILALRPFIPVEFGGSGKQLQPSVAQQANAPSEAPS